MDKDELREKIAKQLYEWIDDDEWEWFEVDEAIHNHYRYKADSILSLFAPELADAEKWRRVKNTHEFKFVRHIESHLSGNQVPICTICSKTIFEIALEGEVKEIEALLDGQRCQWRLTCFGWETECGNKYPYILTQINKCCSFCGKRIEVKDGRKCSP